MAGELWTVDLGVVEYREAWALQERVRAARQADAIPDTLLLLEHPPVYARGRRSTPGELADGRGLVPGAGDRHRRRRPRRPADLPRPRPARRLPDHARRPTSWATCSTHGGGDRHRARRRGRPGTARALRPTGATSSASGPPSARSPRSACTARARSRPTASRSTSTTTCSPSSGSCRAACPTCA